MNALANLVNRARLLLLLALFLLGSAGCGRSSATTPTATAPLSPSLAATATPLPPTATPLPTATATPTFTPTVTPTPTPAFPVHRGTALPPLAPIGDRWGQVQQVAEYASGKPSQLLRGSLTDVLAIYPDKVEVFRGTETKPRLVFPVRVDPGLQRFSVGEAYLAVAGEDKVEVYNTEGQVVYSLTPEEGEVIRAVALSPDGSQVAYSAWKWGAEDVTSFVRDKTGEVVASIPGTVLAFSAPGHLLFVHEGSFLRAYNTQDYALAYAIPIGKGEVFYAIHPQGDRVAFLDRVFGWSYYAQTGWPVLHVYDREKIRRSFDADRWGLESKDFFTAFSLPTTWNPWGIALSDTGDTVAVFYREGPSTAFAPGRYAAFSVPTGERVSQGEWTPCLFPWVNDQGEVGCQGPALEDAVLYRTTPIYFHADADGWIWAWEKWMPWTSTVTVTRAGEWNTDQELPAWIAQKHPPLPSAGFLKWAGEGKEYRGYLLRFLPASELRLQFQITIERQQHVFWEHSFPEGFVSTHEPLSGLALAADDSLFAYVTTNVADYLQYRRIPPKTTIYFVTLQEGVAKPKPLVIEGLADKCLEAPCQIPVAICNQHYLAVAPPGHPVEIYHLPEGELVHTFSLPRSAIALGCTEDTLSALDSTGALWVYGIPQQP